MIANCLEIHAAVGSSLFLGEQTENSLPCQKTATINYQLRQMTSIKRFTPAFLALIDETARKCFGNLPIVNHRTGFQLLKKKPIGPILAKYYTPDNTRSFKAIAPDYMTELEERRADSLDRLKRRGKGPPKKGQGKRSKKKK